MLATATDTHRVVIPRPHARQSRLVWSKAKRILGCIGRRGGKTEGAEIRSARQIAAAIEGGYEWRILYATPSSDQLTHYWEGVSSIYEPLIDAGVMYRNRSRHELRIGDITLRAKTAWHADMLRGDSADDLILDEYQLMSEDMFDKVGAPMLADRNGSALLLFTPPAPGQRNAASKAADKMHAVRRWINAADDDRWERHHWTSHDNPHISQTAVAALAADMLEDSYRMEILAEPLLVASGALWVREYFQHKYSTPDCDRVVVGVDPSGSRDGDSVGIVAVGRMVDGGYIVLDDRTVSGAFPEAWARAVSDCAKRWGATRVIAERNFGGDMVKSVLRAADAQMPVRSVTASRGKQVRAEPIAALYARGEVWHMEGLTALEDELCMWAPGSTWTPGSDWSPDRMDALVWALSDLALGRKSWDVVI